MTKDRDRLEAKVYRASQEDEITKWLGDAFIAGEEQYDFEESGPSVIDQTITIKTPDGHEQVFEGDVITRNCHGDFNTFSPEEFSDLGILLDEERDKLQ